MGADASSPRWGSCSLQGLNITARAGLDKDALPGGSGIRIPPHFWGESLVAKAEAELGFPVYAGYSEARALMGEGATEDLRRLSREAQGMVAEMFASLTVGRDELSRDDHEAAARPRVVHLRLSHELALWKSTQHAIGNVLPPKGKALRQASPQVLAQLGAADWPEALTTNNAVFGGLMSDMLIGAVDVRTMFSNYVIDIAFHYEYGYMHVFPTLQGLVQDGIADAHALGTPYGRERREAVAVGLPYIQEKVALEVEHKTHLKDRSAQMDRRAAQVIYLFDSSVLGVGAEATARGFDVGAIMSDLVLSNNSHDVIDVGSDLVNSEIMNSFLNVADIAASGVVSEPALRAIYDAYAATGARTFTQRWHEPSARMVVNEYSWHITNDRHMLFRRALLGWPKARKSPAWPQREADFDEVFDADFHTTGFSRPLDPEYACDGEETCNYVRRFLLDHRDEEDQMLGALWWSLVTGPLEYVRQGEVDGQREEHLAESLRLQLAQLYSKGLIVEMTWLLAHASHHAWQVNYLYEAAMFGSILDGGALSGKLDRTEEGEEVDLAHRGASEVLAAP
ncbi:uncharacterized protein LOC123395949 [Hordeum vulgare subsp. vulgare]|uniref:uncharacterized protein LOC123395949 n=1 Tax=Hordeum vulgare subsp. vulgare TaxID=112509 RepID=UPI001D1A350A|nr:uncharacterized protein LOC123395949 [Hordeum vulgare subsp. vulgare]